MGSGGGGGGGSGFPASATFEQGVQAGDGLVTITDTFPPSLSSPGRASRLRRRHRRSLALRRVEEVHAATADLSAADLKQRAACPEPAIGRRRSTSPSMDPSAHGTRRAVSSSQSLRRTARSPSQRETSGTSLEDRGLVVGALEVVVGDLRVEMVDVVEADVAGEELQDLGEPQVRAPAERRVDVGPFRRALPPGVLKLVLHVEEPDPDPAGERDERQLRPAGSRASRATSRARR